MKNYVRYFWVLFLVIAIGCNNSPSENKSSNVIVTLLPSPVVAVQPVSPLEQVASTATLSIKITAASSTIESSDNDGVTILATDKDTNSVENTPTTPPTVTTGSSKQVEQSPTIQAIAPNPTSENNSNFQNDLEAQSNNFQIVQADQTGKLELPLFTPENSIRSTAVNRELIFLTTVDSASGRTATIWRKNLEPSSQAQIVSTLDYQDEAFPTGLVLSHDGNFLVYGQQYDQRSKLMEAWLLDIDTGDLTLIDQDVMPQFNGVPFIWSPDGTSLVYTKATPDWSQTMLFEYELETATATMLVEDSALLALVSWYNTSLFYTPVSPTTGILMSFNFQTNEIKSAFSLPDTSSLQKIISSPNRKQVLLAGNVILNLETTNQTSIDSQFDLIWLPDSQGVLGGTPATAFLDRPSSSDNATSQLFQFPSDVNGDQFLSWSSDGQYLVYEDGELSDQKTYYLLNLFSGEKEILLDTSGNLSVGGWRYQ